MGQESKHIHVCENPSCSCRHDHDHKHDLSASHVIENSMTLSDTRSISFISPVASSEVEEHLKKCFIELGDRLAVEGVILGHIKGTVKMENGTFLAFSVTRRGQVDITASDAWSSKNCVNHFSLTVNILSVHKADLDLEEIFIFSALSPNDLKREGDCP